MDLKERTLAHYDRMILWVKKQNPDENISHIKMLESLGEHWYCEYCPLCNEVSSCGDCPIYKSNEKFFDCFGTPWVKMSNSQTWKEWLVYANEERDFLNSLDFGDKEDKEKLIEDLERENKILKKENKKLKKKFNFKLIY